MPFNAEDFKDDKAFNDYINSLVNPLSTANEGLKKDISKLKKKAKSFEGIDPEEYKTLKDELAELKKKKEEGETETEKQLRVAREQHQKEMKDLKNEVALLSDDNKTMKVDATLSVALAKAKVKDGLLDAAIKLIKPDVSLVMVEGKRVAMIGEKTIPEYVDEWCNTEVGKTFTLAKRNSGGNGKGPGQSVSEDAAEKFFDKKSSGFNRTKQLEIKKENEELYKTLLKKHDSGMFERVYKE